MSYYTTYNDNSPLLIIKKRLVKALGMFMIGLTAGCANTNNVYTAQQMAEGIDLATKKNVCYNLDFSESRIIPIKEFESRLRLASTTPLRSRDLDSVLAISYTKEDADSGVVFIPNRPLATSSLPPKEIGIHELIHSSLTFAESKELTKKIQRLGIHLAIDYRDNVYLETPAYLVNYMLKGQYKNLRNEIISLYLEYDIDLPCIDKRLS